VKKRIKKYEYLSALEKKNEKETIAQKYLS